MKNMIPVLLPLVALFVMFGTAKVIWTIVSGAAFIFTLYVIGHILIALGLWLAK